jgi:hypothetical protein
MDPRGLAVSEKLPHTKVINHHPKPMHPSKKTFEASNVDRTAPK